MFFYKEKIDLEEIEEARITLVDAEENRTYMLFKNEDKFMKKLQRRIHEHNQWLNRISPDEVISIRLFLGLGPGFLVIEQKREDYDQLFNILDESIEDIIQEEAENIDPGAIEKVHQKTEEIKHLILKKWAEYLMENEDFKLCSNQNLRRQFSRDHYSLFIQTKLTEEEKEMLPYIRQLDWNTELEFAWKKVKNQQEEKRRLSISSRRHK